MRAVVAVCLLGAAGLWAWAFLWPKQPAPFPAEYAGEYRLAQFQSPKGVPMVNPYPRSQRIHYFLRKDGSYLISARLRSGHELNRYEGVVTMDDEGVITLTQVSRNRLAESKPPQRYGMRWHVFTGDDPARVLVLTHAEEGYELYLEAVGGGADRQ